MAFGEVIDKNIRTSNNWSLLAIEAAFSTVMPSHYMNSSLMAMPLFPSYLGKLSNYNKRDRLLQELKVHMNLRVSGSKSALNLDYLEALRDAISRPMQKGDVAETVEVMNHYCLRKEDIESIMELSTFKGQVDPMTKVDAKTKAALTRTMNKEGELLPYAYGAGAAKKGRAKGADELPDELGSEDESGALSEEEGEDGEEKNAIEQDAMIKKVAHKPKAAPKKRKATEEKAKAKEVKGKKPKK